MMYMNGYCSKCGITSSMTSHIGWIAPLKHFNTCLKRQEIRQLCKNALLRAKNVRKAKPYSTVQRATAPFHNMVQVTLHPSQTQLQHNGPLAQPSTSSSSSTLWQRHRAHRFGFISLLLLWGLSITQPSVSSYGQNQLSWSNNIPTCRWFHVKDRTLCRTGN